MDDYINDIISMLKTNQKEIRKAIQKNSEIEIGNAIDIQEEIGSIAGQI